MRYYIIGTDGNVHGEADNKEKCEMMLGDLVTFYEREYGKEYVEELELEIVEGR